jgi:predicted site-specific integrase-resolvase
VSNPDEILNTTAACEILGVERSTLNRWAQMGRVPVMKLPGHTGAYIYRRGDIEALRDARAKTASDEPGTNGAVA